MNASDLRQEIPVLGLKEYWYPALKAVLPLVAGHATT